MNYIYDILLNWCEGINIYEFYEWSTTDDLEHVKKMPIIKINNKDLNTLYKSDIVIVTSILNSIYQKTILFKNKSGSTIEYGVIFTDGLKALAIEFNKKGESIYKSNLLLEEESEAIELVKKVDCTKVEYKVINKYKRRKLMTRFEEGTKVYLRNEFRKIYDEKNISKLKYLYNEWYNKTSDDFNYMYNKINAILNKEWSKKHIKLYNLIKLSYVNK